MAQEMETVTNNGVELFAYLKATLEASASGHPRSESISRCPGRSSNVKLHNNGG